MKRLCILLLWIGLGLGAWAQSSNLVIFSANNDVFTVVVNGFRLNDRPSANLKVTGLQAGGYDVQVLFSNPSLQGIRQQVQLESDRELTLSTERNAGGASSLNFVNEFSLTAAYAPAGTQVVVPYVGTASHAIAGALPADDNPTVTAAVPAIVEPALQEGPSRPNPLPGYSGTIGCDYPMDAIAFEAAKKGIAEKPYASSRLTAAKQVTGANCLLTSQVNEILGLFTFESDKLELAKYAHAYTYDRDNYYKVNDSFTFSSSIDELKKFLEGK